MANSQPYPPLPTTQSIRLLYLQRGDDDRADIKCRLVAHTIKKTPAYEALSYVWGSREPAQRIYVNDLSFDVTPNLFAALRQLRSLRPPRRRRGQDILNMSSGTHKRVAKVDELETEFPFARRNDHHARTQGPKERILWIDAICINQKENTERTHQVNLMASIYSRASRVVIWLATEEGDAVDFLPILSTAMMEYKTGSRENPENPSKNMRFTKKARTGYPDFEDGRWASVLRLYDQEWFERLWVMQEVALARSAIALLGALELDWETLGGTAVWLVGCQLASVYPPGNEHLERSVLDRAVVRMNTASHIYHARSMRNSLYLIDLACSKFNCTLPLDRIYGTLSLITDISIDPDYAKEPADVFTSVTRQLIETRQDLLVLGQVCHPPDSPQTQNNFPSWVPRWPNDFYYWSSNCQSDFNSRAYMASAGQDFGPLGQPDEKVLALRGIDVNRVVACSSIMLHATGTWFSILDPIREFMISYLNSEGSNTLGCYEDEDRDCVFAQVLTNGQSRVFVEASTDPDFPAAACGLWGWIKKAIKRSEVNEQHDPPNDHLEDTAQESLAYDVLAGTIDLTCHLRRIFETSDGHFGLGPQAMKAGDIVVVLFGANTPFVVRPVPQQGEEPGASQKFYLIGECYVHGMMKGEIIKGWRDDLYESRVFELV